MLGFVLDRGSLNRRSLNRPRPHFSHRIASRILAGAIVGSALLLASCAPPPPNCVTDVAVLKQDHATFNRLIASAGLDTVLCEGGPYTVFAPTDEAFVQLPPGRLEEWSQPENRERLRSLLLSHVVRGELSEQDLTQKSTVTTANGKMLSLTGTQGRVSVEQAVITGSGAKAKNGVVYPINAVLQP